MKIQKVFKSGLVFVFLFIMVSIMAQSIIEVVCWSGQCEGECLCRGTYADENGPCCFNCAINGYLSGVCCGWYPGFPEDTCIPEGPR